MTPRFRPNAFTVKPSRFGRGGVLWRDRPEYNHVAFGAAVIQHAYSARWTALIGHNLRGFCARHEVTGYDRFRGVLRGDLIMRDEDRARMLTIFGPDAIADAPGISRYLQDVYEDTGLRLIAPRPRRNFDTELNAFYLQTIAATPNPPGGDLSVEQLSSMAKMPSTDPFYDALQRAAEQLYRDHDESPIRWRLIEIDHDPDPLSNLAGSVYGYFGGGGLVVTGYPKDGDLFEVIDGVLVVAVHEHDEAGRPIRVSGMRAVPERLVDEPADISWEIASCPARVYYSDNLPLVRWEEPDLNEAGTQWAEADGRDYA